MGRFVPMGILSDKTTDVGRGIFAFQPGIQGKETVEFGYKSFGTSVRAISPSTSCCTNQEYCQALPSVYSSSRWLE